VNPGPTFERVYIALKEQLTSGRYPPSSHLEPAALGDELNASITPVRDALHRLVGERLVEAPRNDGFKVPAPLESELRHLYGWNGQLLELALRSAAFRSAAESSQEMQWTSRDAGDLFRNISRLSGNPEHEATIENLNDRLAALRLAESGVFPDLAEELEAMRAALAARDRAGLRRLIGAYHRRRQRCVPEILSAVRKPRRQG
jgi:DNA-binding GntR family transcriptional regulator